MASAMNVIAKYLICVIDLRRARQRGGENAPPWQNKSMWIFYVELATGMSTFGLCMLYLNVWPTLTDHLRLLQAHNISVVLLVYRGSVRVTIKHNQGRIPYWTLVCYETSGIDPIPRGYAQYG